MEKKLQAKIVKFIEPNIEDYHKRILENLLSLKMDNVLKRKNPYLFKAKNVLTAQDIIKSILDAHLSSQEEGIFGEFLEKTAIFICGEIYKGQKSSSEGIDLEFTKDNMYYIVSIKSGPNWGNSQQIRRMVDNFKRAKRVLGTNASKRGIIAVNGCCYGIDDNPDKGDYVKLCGQRFWELVSGDEKLYTEIIEPIGYKAKEKNAKFNKEYAKVINKFTMNFGKEYCAKDGSIRWDELTKYNSGKKKNLQIKY